MATYDEKMASLLAQLDTARASNNTSGLLQAARAIAALEKEAEKAEREAQAGELAALEKVIQAEITETYQKHVKDMRRLGVKGFVVGVTDTKNPSWTFKGPKARSGGGGGGAGKTKDQYGQSLGEVFEAFATDEDRAALEAAKGDGNKTYAIKVGVKKRAIAQGLLTPQS